MNERENDLVAAYALGDLSEAEREEAERLCERDSEAREELRALRAALNRIGAWEPPVPDHRLAALPMPRLAAKAPLRSAQAGWPRWMRAAALLALGFGLGWLARAPAPIPADSAPLPGEARFGSIPLATNFAPADSNPASAAAAPAAASDWVAAGAIACLGFAMRDQAVMSGLFERPRWVGLLTDPDELWNAIPLPADTAALEAGHGIQG